MVVLIMNLGWPLLVESRLCYTTMLSLTGGMVIKNSVRSCKPKQIFQPENRF
jgi:hypothetical protein